MKTLLKVWDGKPGVYIIFCPGCNSQHLIPTIESIWKSGARWNFTGTVDMPTFNPSLVVSTGKHAMSKEELDRQTPQQMEWLNEQSTICHSFITNGRIQYLPDCTHALASQTVDLPDLDERGLPLK